MSRRALLVIDMSIEQVSGVSFRKTEVIQNIRKLARSGRFALSLDTRLWIADPSKTSLTWVYPSVGHAGNPGAEILPELRDLNLTFVKKLNFSCFVDSELDECLRKASIQEVYLTGINTDYCVL
eukprot:RCo048634